MGSAYPASADELRRPPRRGRGKRIYTSYGRRTAETIPSREAAVEHVGLWCHYRAKSPLALPRL